MLLKELCVVRAKVRKVSRREKVIIKLRKSETVAKKM